MSQQIDSTKYPKEADINLIRAQMNDINDFIKKYEHLYPKWSIPIKKYFNEKYDMIYNEDKYHYFLCFNHEKVDNQQYVENIKSLIANFIPLSEINRKELNIKEEKYPLAKLIYLTLREKSFSGEYLESKDYYNGVRKDRLKNSLAFVQPGGSKESSIDVCKGECEKEFLKYIDDDSKQNNGTPHTTGKFYISFISELNQFKEPIKDEQGLSVCLKKITEEIMESRDNFLKKITPPKDEMRVLALSAEPSDFTRFPADNFIVEEVLEKEEVLYDLKSIEHVTRAVLEEQIKEALPHVLHINVHGESDGSLQFENDQKKSDGVSTDEFIQILSSIKSPFDAFKVIILNGCFTAILAREIIDKVDEIGFVVGNTEKVCKNEVHSFTKKFYETYRYERNVEKAYEEAIKYVNKVVGREDFGEVCKLFSRD